MNMGTEDLREPSKSSNPIICNLSKHSITCVRLDQKKVMFNSVSVVTTPDHYASLPRLQSKSQSEKTQPQHSMGMDKEGSTRRKSGYV